MFEKYSNKLLSIIIPTYNSLIQLKNNVNKIINSGYTDLINIIIIDDHSKDDTYSYVKDLQSLYPNIVYHKNECNLGVGLTRNIGISLAKTKYICFVDSDDFIEMKFVNRNYFIDCLNKDNDLIFYKVNNNARSNADYENIFRHSTSDKTKYLTELMNIYNFHLTECFCCLIKRNLIVSKKIFFENYRIGEDIVFINKLFLNAKTYAYTNKIRYTHTAKVGGLATTFRKDYLYDIFNAFNKYKNYIFLKNSNTQNYRMRVLKEIFTQFVFFFIIHNDITTQKHCFGFDKLLKFAVDNYFSNYQPCNESASMSKYYMYFEEQIINIINYKNIYANSKNYIYCLSPFSMAVYTVLIKKGIGIDAIIDDNRISFGYNIKGVPLRTLAQLVKDIIPISSNNSNYYNFFICHHGEDVFIKLKKKLIDAGVPVLSIFWINVSI